MPGLNVPSPLLIKTYNAPLDIPTRSARPSPLRSAAASQKGKVPVVAVLMGDWKVPSPFPSNTESVLIPPSSRSGLPSPLKSATASAPPGTGVPTLKVPSPFPKPKTPEEHNRSGLPSPLKSATNKAPEAKQPGYVGG